MSRQRETLHLHKELYNRSCIYSGINAYRLLAHIRVQENGNYWVCSFSDCVYDPDLTAHEFENYLINLMNAVQDHENS